MIQASPCCPHECDLSLLMGYCPRAPTVERPLVIIRRVVADGPSDRRRPRAQVALELRA